MNQLTPDRPTEARNDALAVFALLGGLFLPPLGLLFGHLSNRDARDAGRRRSPLAVTGLYLAYAWVILGALVLYQVYPALGWVLWPAAVIVIVAAVMRKRQRNRSEDAS